MAGIQYFRVCFYRTLTYEGLNAGIQYFFVFTGHCDIQGSHGWDTIFPCFYRTLTYKGLKAGIQYFLVFTGH